MPNKKLKIPKSDGPCGRDMQGVKLVMYQGKCMHPNEVKRLQSRNKIQHSY